MKKIFTLALLSFVFSSAVNAQTYLVDSIAYTPYSYTGGTAGISGDDAISTAISIPFAFQFYGSMVNQIYVSTNGYMMFNTISGAYLYIAQTIPNAALPNHIAALCWTDLMVAAPGNTNYYVSGTSPNQVMVFNWDNVVQFASGPGHLTGQIVLHESTSIIEMFMDSCSGFTMNHTQGLEDYSGSAAVYWAGRNNSSWSAHQDGKRFTPSGFIVPGSNHIQGNVIGDSNNNCIYDSVDIHLNNAVIKMVENGSVSYAFTNAGGDYNVWVDSGNYTLSMMPYYNTLVECPTGNSYSVYFPATYDSSMNNNFADTGSFCPDLSVYQWGNLRYCNHGWNHVNIHNTALTPSPAAQVRVEMPDSVYYVGGHPVDSIVGKSLYFSIPSLNPQGGYYITWYDSVSCDATLGTHKFIYAQLSNGWSDCHAANDSFGYWATVTNSWDPNEKSAVAQNPSANGNVTAETITPTFDLNYSIAFQNTGNDTARNVIIRDTLSPMLDPTTVVPLGESHACSFVRDGNVLIWFFNNIMLPDSGVNQAASHGFVSYKVKQMTGNLPGQVIMNSGSIYFDNNPAVVTNTTLHTIATPAGTVSISTNQLQLFPNPASNFIVIGGMNTGDGIELTNALGQKVANLLMHSNQLDISNLTEGIYFVRLLAKSGDVKTGSFVISR